MREPLDLENVLQTAVGEMRRYVLDRLRRGDVATGNVARRYRQYAEGSL